MKILTPSAIRPRKFASPLYAALLFWLTASCSSFATRPVQEMSDAEAALRAAREVQADTNATAYYRVAEEYFFKARQEYRLKNFARAKKFASQARHSAERAEFMSIRGGAVRSSLSATSNEGSAAATPETSASPSATPEQPPTPPTAPADSPSSLPTP